VPSTGFFKQYVTQLNPAFYYEFIQRTIVRWYLAPSFHFLSVRCTVYRSQLLCNCSHLQSLGENPYIPHRTSQCGTRDNFTTKKKVDSIRRFESAFRDTFPTFLEVSFHNYCRILANKIRIHEMLPIIIIIVIIIITVTTSLLPQHV